MSQEVVVAESVRAVSSALGEMLKTYQLSRTVRRAEVAELKERISDAKAVAAAHAGARLFRVHIQEIAETMRCIDAEDLSGPALEYAMDQMRLLHIALKRNAEALL